MLQSAIYSQLQADSFLAYPRRPAPRLPLLQWAKVSFSVAIAWLRANDPAAGGLPLSPHLRRDIGLVD